jgi:hypothetical protein
MGLPSMLKPSREERRSKKGKNDLPTARERQTRIETSAKVGAPSTSSARTVCFSKYGVKSRRLLIGAWNFSGPWNLDVCALRHPHLGAPKQAKTAQKCPESNHIKPHQQGEGAIQSNIPSPFIPLPFRGGHTKQASKFFIYVPASLCLASRIGRPGVCTCAKQKEFRREH